MNCLHLSIGQLGGEAGITKRCSEFKYFIKLVEPPVIYPQLKLAMQQKIIVGGWGGRIITFIT